MLHYGPVFMLGVLAFAWLRHRGGSGDLAPSRLTRSAHVIAKYSYGIYLLHIPAAGVAFVWGASWPAAVQWSVYAALVVALPIVGYHAIERPGITLGKRLAGGVSVRPQLEPVP